MTRRFSSGVSMLGIAGRRPGPHQLFNTTDPNFRPSRPLPKSFVPRPGPGKPGTNSFWNVTKRGVAGMGFAGSKNCGQHEGHSDGNLDLYLLCYVTHIIRTTVLGLGVPGLQMIPALATAWDIPGSAWRGDAPESAWQGEVCVTTAAGRSCFSAAPSTIHFTGRTSRLASPIPVRWSLSLAAGLCRSNTWHRTKGIKSSTTFH